MLELFINIKQLKNLFYWVSDCCLALSEQFLWTMKYVIFQWDDGDVWFVLDQLP
jgi:hypothetical protein